MMGDGKALQSGTSHNLGQNFAKAFEIKYLDKTGVQQFCWTTSWGLSTRVVGAIIMVHGDDQGLVLPPKLAPYQVVIVPISKTDEERAQTIEAARKLKSTLETANYRVKIDERDGFSPGFKFNDWEMRGVPLRIEIGPKDLAKNSVMLARRDRPGREGKSPASMDDIAGMVGNMLSEIQAGMLAKALAFRESRTSEPKDYPEFKTAVETGFARSYWCGERGLRSED